jgi:hypothetical protein
MRCRCKGKHRYNQKYRPGPATLHKSLLFLKGAYVMIGAHELLRIPLQIMRCPRFLAKRRPHFFKL